MSECIDLLDQALGLVEQEIACLRAGEPDQAESLASERAKLIRKAGAMFPGQDKALLRDRLERLMALQKEATIEATELKEDIRKRLGRTKKEVKRFAGYAGASKPVSRIPNKYLNKQG